MFTENPVEMEKLKYKKLQFMKLRSKTNYTITDQFKWSFSVTGL